MRESLKRVVVLTLIVLISSVVLYQAYNVMEVEERTAAYKQLKFEKMLKNIFPSVTEEVYDAENDFYRIYSEDQCIGYAFMAAGKGYGGDIEILIGLNNDKTIKGIEIIKQTETPGMGVKITEKWFTDQFGNATINEIGLKRSGGAIDAITGATKSSRAVVNAVHEAVMEKIKLIEEAGEKK